MGYSPVATLLGKLDRPPSGKGTESPRGWGGQHWVCRLVEAEVSLSHPNPSQLVAELVPGTSCQGKLDSIRVAAQSFNIGYPKG